jgi:hypothetical protein
MGRKTRLKAETVEVERSRKGEPRRKPLAFYLRKSHNDDVRESFLIRVGDRIKFRQYTGLEGVFSVVNVDDPACITCVSPYGVEFRAGRATVELARKGRRS